ncbi:unnamed protein product, partial [Staurois parvus]
MIGSSHRGPVQRSVFHCVRRTQRAPDRSAARSQKAHTCNISIFARKLLRTPKQCIYIYIYIYIYFFFFFFFFFYSR